MTTRDISCAAQRSLQEIKTRQVATKNNPLITAHNQYIGGTGVVVPTSIASQKFPILDPSRNQGIQISQPIPSSNATPLASRGTFTPGAAASTAVVRGIGRMSDIATDKTGSGSAHKLRMSQSGVLYTLHMIREPVVEYQETRGIPRNEEITFVTLVTSLCTQAYTAAITILVMLWNLMPLVDGLVYFVRFFLDKLIDIVETPDTKDKAIKGAIFFGELTVITFIIFLIVGLIFMPVYVLMARLFSKVFSMIAW